jgi:signal transduction histidine kinase
MDDASAGTERSAIADNELVERLAELPSLAAIPREELAWLVANGRLVIFEPGDAPAPRGQPVEHMWIVLSGRIVVRVDHGSGPRTVMAWRTGDVTGHSPYSRIKGSPGENFATERTESLALHVRHFPEMVRCCPEFTAHTVHVMLDRARSFSAAELHDEKMVSLGRLAAGLAHELNNPASATVRASKTLLEGLREGDTAARALGAQQLTSSQLAALERLRYRCLEPVDAILSPIERADRQDALEDWLDRRGSDPDLADPLAETELTTDDLDELAGVMGDDALDVALHWLAAGCALNALATDIAQAATRIHELVNAVKSFTYMDRLASPEQVDVAGGLRDTLRVINSKAKSKNATVTLDIEPDLPPVHANGAELNQVWLNLIDNALDAIAESGRIEITARQEVDHAIVSIIDDGPGIAADMQARIFDAFFTTKPPGEGTGLGLDIAQRLVRRHGGEIAVESRPGRTAFRVSLIAVRDQPHAIRRPPG